MKWFKFLIYFALFAGAALNAISGIQMLTGEVYGEYKEYVYAVFEDLKTLDMIVGILMLATAALGIYTRFRLAGYYANGPKMLSVVYAMAVLVNLVYIIGVNSILSEAVMESVDTSSSITSMLVSAVMIIINNTYFKKRAHLFVN